MTYAAKATHTARQIDKGEGKGGEARRVKRERWEGPASKRAKKDARLLDYLG